jgi:hypothetical protein
VITTPRDHTEYNSELSSLTFPFLLTINGPHLPTHTRPLEAFPLSLTATGIPPAYRWVHGLLNRRLCIDSTLPSEAPFLAPQTGTAPLAHPLGAQGGRAPEIISFKILGL